MFVWYGTATYDPRYNEYPDEDVVGPTPDAYVGERVTLSGEVVATAPVAMEIEHKTGTWLVTLEEAPTALVRGDRIDVGDRLAVHGTLTAPDTLRPNRAYTREPWETTYMYAVSAVAVVWVFGRSVRGWRFDRERLAFVPRDGAEPDRSRGAPKETTAPGSIEGDRDG